MAFCVVSVVKLSVVNVAPAILVNVEPPLVLTCHCTLGVGFPVAAAVKVAVLPATTDWLTGFVVTVGAKFTVNVAAVVVAEPPGFVNTARYLKPFCPAVTLASVKVVVVAPETLENVAPPSVETCHCTVGVGDPLAAAVNTAVCPAFTVESVGFVVTTGPVLVFVSEKFTVVKPEAAAVTV